MELYFDTGIPGAYETGLELEQQHDITTIQMSDLVEKTSVEPPQLPPECLL